MCAAGLALLLAAGGCSSTPDPGASLEASAVLVRQGVPGARPGGDAGEPLMLEGKTLTQGQAVAIAIGRSPAIAADLARIREAQAQYVQAGVLPNPSLYGSVGFASDGGIGFAMASLTQSLSALWQRGDKQAIAHAQLQQMIVRAAFNTLETAGAVERLHRQVVYRQDVMAQLQEKAKLLEEMARAGKDRFDTGAGDALEMNAIKAQALRAALERQQAEAELADSKRKLLEAMGTAGASAEFIAERATLETLEAADETKTLSVGLGRRLDVQAARWAATAAANDVALAKNKAIPEMSVGVEYQKDDSMRTVGPAGTIELPIFDQGQARIAAAKAAQEREEAMRQAVVEQATLQIRQAWVAFDSRQLLAGFQRSQVVPLAESTLVLKRSAFDTGDANLLDVLGARVALLEAHMGLIQAQYEAEVARIELKQAMGGYF